ncbi:RagB/SusD family nutrient uptake outer membrane protein [Paraflavitalea sp. CAU 1676]|uniref:RagB/SusD family nutrient uptake outer membrane protein n=1 Tax=Paraflavitalea sp. CAU 1676 TaxID=3032598 RepID=UPI0023DAA987|nr:RagB/SusD family nutrient uptake outer membrane protein [Paraflavitalea sp. CAU 1676]MDF2192118.1 RagB/SusD family nutrient uptake outer membrane protein [Paraflavitalea sp. CAU 1676]
MKTLQIAYSVLIAAGLLTTSCNKEFLEADPRGQFLEDKYYRNEQEAYNGLVAVYDVVGWQGGGYVTKIGTMDAGSDDHFAGGGGPNDITNYQVFSNYTLSPAVGPHLELWAKGFSGIFRANTLLAKLPKVPMDENNKKRFTAEAKFLRAYFYFDLVRFFKSIPLLTEPVAPEKMYDVLQVTSDVVYAQIEKDLKEAFAELPASLTLSTQAGRATKAAAQSLLGKMYLWQKKYKEAAAEFAVVNGTPGGTGAYGNKLFSTFAGLFSLANEFNTESVFEISYTNTSAGGWGCVSCTEGNVLNIMTGPRGYNRKDASAPDYVSGWSFLPVTDDLFNVMKDDPRLNATIANLKQLETDNKITYQKGYMNTGYFLEKTAGRESFKWTGAGNMELNFPKNMYDMRLADLYLLEAEALLMTNSDLPRAQALLDAVRDRAYGDALHRVPLTLNNLKLERRMELAGEGHRWLDLVRWGDAPTVLGPRGFKAGKHEYLPIPILELENTKIEQLKEWGGTK